MKSTLYLLSLVVTLLACKPQDPTPQGYLKPLSLAVDPLTDGLTLSWTPVFFFEEGMYGGPAPLQPTQYEVYISQSDETSLQRVAVLEGSLSTYVLRNLPADKPVYAQIKALRPGLATSESNVATTFPGQLGATSSLFPDPPAAITYGDWSGSTLLYANWSDSWTLRSTSGQTRTLKKEGNQPVLSPDGTMIAYLAARNTNTSYDTQLVIKTLDSGTIRLLDTQSAIYSAEWSTSGKSLAYVTGGELWTVSIADGKRTRIAKGNWNGTQSRFTWSADDRSILISQQRSIPTLSRYVVNLLRVPLTGGEPQPLLVSNWQDEQPTLSPDGTRLAFYSYRSGYQAVWLLELSTGRLHQLTGSKERFYYINRLDWLDNKQLTYTSFAAGAVDTMLKKVVLP